MLDLVKAQTERIDATFLEPACGSGNFLAEILRRKLAVVEKQSFIGKTKKRNQYKYEFDAILAISSLYGIELLQDNVEQCHQRLLSIFNAQYQSYFPNTFQPKCLKTAEHILKKNILCGNALTMKSETIDPITKQLLPNDPLVFTEWKGIGSNIHRRDFIYQQTVETEKSGKAEINEQGQTEFFSIPIKTYPPIPFLCFLEELGND
ncbi:SAM-dependent DNA methyltransferase [Bibersteinia trehalosi]|uniref:SAM-dependent DNA methyltransferase n=1 Tax=Bibersteinia trehalosi TaxID=47735 RepID=A0A426FGC9_BIBTR|nr:DNA methyltransferase [Bibersteinia trehalosi]RRN01789.1 SAM-dependent DNA methyltransferase [Bibersteinia trehalosi]